MTVATTQPDGARYYTIPTPDGGTVDLPSATTVGKVLRSPQLDKWKIKVALWTTVHDPDLLNLVASAPNHKERAVWDAATQALDRNRGAANTGTALHTLTERADADEFLTGLTPELETVMAGYNQLCADHGMVVVETEQIVTNLAVGYAGRFDKVADLANVGRVILDVKTGGAVYPEVALQLAAYAHAETIYDENTNTFRPLPDGIRTDLGAVLHLPRNGDAPTLMLVDLAHAWATFQGAVALHRWETVHAKTALIGPHTPGPDIAEERNRARRAYLIAAIGEMKGADLNAVEHLVTAWPPGVPSFRQAEHHTDQQLDAIAAVVHDVAALYGVPFFTVSDPATTAEPLASADDCYALARRLDALPSDLRSTITDAMPIAGRLWNTRCTINGAGTLRTLLDDQEETHRWRVGVALERLPDDPGHAAAVLRLVGVTGHHLAPTDTRLDVDQLVTGGLRLTATHLDRVLAVTAALKAGHLTVTATNGQPSVIVAEPTVPALIEEHGGKGALLAVAREVARTHVLPPPKSAATLETAPLLTALVAVGVPTPTNDQQGVLI